MNPSIVITILLITFVLLIMTECPITFSMIISTASTILYIQVPVMTLAQQMFKQLNSFLLLAIPFFILMGEIMAAGDISSHPPASANVYVGWMTGGLTHVNVLAFTLFGGISGSAIADVSPLEALEIPMMEEAGYEKNFSTAVTVASSCQGLIIPPSHNMVLYSIVAGGASVGSLFYADYIPGIMLEVFIVGMCYIISEEKHYPKGKELPFKEALRVTKDTFFAVLAVITIIGDISAGFSTTTESAAVAYTYCLFVGFFIYRELHLKDISVVLGNTVKTLSMVYALIIAVGVFDWMMAYLNVPTLVTNLLPSISDNKIVVLFLINLTLLLLGYVIDLTPLVFVVAPILLPVMTRLEMSPIQFGVMMMLNLGIGLCTPPMGITLLAGCAIGNMKIEEVSGAMLPLYIPIPITLLLVTSIPALTMTLPELIVR